LVVLCGIIILAGMAILAWNVSGGRLLVMQTASMCPRVCVGSLVADKPLSGSLHVGELITFNPPGVGSATYTHEIYRILPDGLIQTRGTDNAGIDPWRISRSDIKGRVAFTLPGLGWLISVLPFLAVGLLSWGITRRWVASRHRAWWDTGCATALVVVPLLLLRPLVRASVFFVGVVPSHASLASAKVINTGLLPLSVHGDGGTTLSHLGSSASGHVFIPTSAGMTYSAVASLYWWEWAIVSLLLASPFFKYLLHARRQQSATASGFSGA
jgi:hypothetical protein